MKKKRYRQPKKIKMHSMTERILVAGLFLVCLILIGFCAYKIVTSLGKNGLERHAQNVASVEYADKLSDETEDNHSGDEGEQENYVELQEGQILVDGDIYQYNQDIMTFLCMGVDSRAGVTKEKVPGKGGQADAILLIVANPHTKQLQVININRDSMTDIELYDTDGGYAGTESMQLALQYAYGDGRVRSCELMEKTVSKLFYGIPIHGYAALDMESIPTINDSVGGVEITVLEDMTKYKANWSKGSQIKLTGSDALLYIREREDESAELGSNIKRIERQKQYLTAFVSKVKEKTKEDITFPITIYGKVQNHMVTSLSVDEITYLASTLLGYDLSMENVISISGEMKMGKVNEEFYIDDEDLRSLIIETFYEKVE